MIKLEAILRNESEQLESFLHIAELADKRTIYKWRRLVKGLLKERCEERESELVGGLDNILEIGVISFAKKRFPQNQNVRNAARYKAEQIRSNEERLAKLESMYEFASRRIEMMGAIGLLNILRQLTKEEPIEKILESTRLVMIKKRN